MGSTYTRTVRKSHLLHCASGILLLIATAVGSSASADTLDKKTVDAVSDATYEVVLLKPTEETITYERPLPLDLIPFSVRNDPYYSIGTAFSIGPNRFVSAGHVFRIGHESLLKVMRLRDRHGKVYDIDQIQKYSLRRDFVVFTVKGAPDAPGLAVNTAPHLNDKVYAVGNALGEGIVFRDGLYTSDTAEEQDGEWKWIRFSAAASPGNSGGPLLDTDGRVVGIVLRKSQSENLNYALPIAEVLKAPDNIADIDTKMLYRIDNMDMTYADRLRKKIALPKSPSALNDEAAKELNRFGDELKDKMFARYRDGIFPNGAGSLRLLNTTYNASFPGIIAKGDDGLWDAYFPSKTYDSDLGANGSMSYGTLGNSFLMLLRKPDDVPLTNLYRDSKLHADLILRGLAFTRTVGVEKIKLTSLGKAVRDEVFTDSYRRNWIVRVWNLAYSDEQMVAFSLPVPGGLVSMIRRGQTEQTVGNMSDLKSLTDFFYVSYYGTFEQWREFLANRDLLPPAFGAIDLDFEYGKQFRYGSKRVQLSYGPDQMNITPNSDLSLRFSYFRENDKVVWDVAQVTVGESKASSTFFGVARNLHPPKQLGDKYLSKWDDITHRHHPYNKRAYFDDKRTLIGQVCANNLGPDQLVAAPLVYTAFFGTDGNVQQSSVEQKLDGFLKSFAVKEY